MASCTFGAYLFFQKYYVNIYSLPGYCSCNSQWGPSYNSGVQDVKKKIHDNTKMVSAFFVLNLSGEFGKVFRSYIICDTTNTRYRNRYENPALILSDIKEMGKNIK